MSFITNTFSNIFNHDCNHCIDDDYIIDEVDINYTIERLSCYMDE